MLVVTHEIGLPADRIVFMADGAIIDSAEAAQFFTNPQSDRAKDFLGKTLNH